MYPSYKKLFTIDRGLPLMAPLMNQWSSMVINGINGDFLEHAEGKTMNGERTFGKAIPDEYLSTALNNLYNVWFRKYKKMKLDDNTFNQAFDEAYWEIVAQYDEYPFVSHMFIALIYELDARMHGGYTETSRDKLLALIRQEGKMT